MSNATPASTGVHLKTSYFVLAFILAFFKPDVSIDGQPPVRVNWGETFFPLAPGPHRVNVWFNYMFFGACGKAETIVEVPAAGALPLHYKAPTWLVFMAGKLIVEGAGPAALPGAPIAGPVGAPLQAQPAATAAPAGDPQWDPQRNAYVQFDPAQQQWMQFNGATQQWVPIT